jgi:glycerate-2-kinase
MKIRRPLFFGVVAATAVSMASIAVSAVAAETPFKGTVNAVETGETVFPIRSIDRTGGGTATYLGKYTEHVTAQINLLTMHATGFATFTAANGDTLSASVDGQATRTGPTVLSIVEVYTITGGTGRFADATGTFTLESTVEQTTGVSSGTFSGVIDH